MRRARVSPRREDRVWRLASRFSISLLLCCLGVLAIVALASARFDAPAAPSGSSSASAEILWDRYGVPHIVAADAPSLFYGFGWAQMQAHGNTILRLYGQARGRGAEYWGEDFAASDRWVRTMGVPARANDWYKRQREPFRACLDAFVRGLNDQAARHPDRLDPVAARVLPISGADVLAHVQHIILFNFLTQRPATREWTAGSNAWAIGPRRSASGKAMLVASPHLPWGGATLLFEAQFMTPEVNASGVALIGQPMLGIGFNEYLGWTHTVNAMDGADLYELALAGAGYRWNGGTRAFDVETQTLKIRGKDGTLADEPLVVKRSIHGPVVAERPGAALALRVAGLEQAFIGDQYWDMARARNLAEFKRAAARLEQPFFTTIYADRAGHILHLFGGRTPVRPPGAFPWSAIVPGDTAATLWTTTHPFEQLPQVTDPASGWLQNANDPPWTTTWPAALSADDYPSYMAPRYMRFRAQRSARMLEESSSLSFQEVAADVFSTRVELADRLLDDLLPPALARGGDAALAAAVLEKWDRTADAESRGGVLFQAWFEELAGSADLSQGRLGQSELFATKWDARRPLATPDGLANPGAAVDALVRAYTRVRDKHGAADIAWGSVYRLQRDQVDLPASGGPDVLGSFNVLGYKETKDGKFAATTGTTYIAVVSFGEPVRAEAVLTTGNWSQPGSPHRSDQIGLYAKKRLRPVWRTRAEIEANLERRETLERPGGRSSANESTPIDSRTIRVARHVGASNGVATKAR